MPPPRVYPPRPTHLLSRSRRSLDNADHSVVQWTRVKTPMRESSFASFPTTFKLIDESKVDAVIAFQSRERAHAESPLSESPAYFTSSGLSWSKLVTPINCIPVTISSRRTVQQEPQSPTSKQTNKQVKEVSTHCQLTGSYGKDGIKMEWCHWNDAGKEWD